MYSARHSDSQTRPTDVYDSNRILLCGTIAMHYFKCIHSFFVRCLLLMMAVWDSINIHSIRYPWTLILLHLHAKLTTVRDDKSCYVAHGTWSTIKLSWTPGAFTKIHEAIRGNDTTTCGVQHHLSRHEYLFRRSTISTQATHSSLIGTCI